MNISSLMRNYLNEASTKQEISDSLFGKVNSGLPVQVESKSKWKVLEDPQRLSRAFSFKKSSQVIQFLEEIFEYQNEVSHQGSALIEDKKVTVEVYTHTVEEVTELDIEYAKEVNKIYRDVKDYG